MDNLPSNAMFRYVLIFSEQKWLYFIICLNNFMIVKHEFGYFKHVSVFALKQLVARILSNKYVWLLLKYKTTDELGTHSDPWAKKRIHIIVCLDGV